MTQTDYRRVSLQGLSAFRAFLQGIPAEVELSRERGTPITFPEASIPVDGGGAKYDSVRALLETLGVEIVGELGGNTVPPIDNDPGPHLQLERERHEASAAAAAIRAAARGRSSEGAATMRRVEAVAPAPAVVEAESGSGSGGATLPLVGREHVKARCRGFGAREGTCTEDADWTRGTYAFLCSGCKVLKQESNQLAGARGHDRGQAKGLTATVTQLKAPAAKLERAIAKTKRAKRAHGQAHQSAKDAFDEFAETLAAVKAAAEELVR